MKRSLFQKFLCTFLAGSVISGTGVISFADDDIVPEEEPEVTEETDDVDVIEEIPVEEAEEEAGKIGMTICSRCSQFSE